MFTLGCLRRGAALLICAAAPLLAQPSDTTRGVTPTAAPSPKKSVKRPDFKNLRFDEVWSSSLRSQRWDDAIKAVPLVEGAGVSLTVAGQLRWREEFFRDFTLAGLNDDNSQSRLLLSADLQAGDRRGAHARVFVEGRDAQSYGRTLPGGTRTADADRHDVQNLFVDAAFGASYVRYGRQEIALGRDRMFGVPDWSNTRRGAQGVRAQIVSGPITLDAIDARPVAVRQTLANRADSTARFRVLALGNSSGANAAATGLPAIWQAYWAEQRITTTVTRTHRVTSGARTQWQWGATTARRYSMEFEGALQRGSAGTRDIRGWFWVAESQVAFRQQRGAPTMAIGVEEASGENRATDDVSEVFTTLYPAAHSHGGYADVIGRANVRELHAITTWDPYSTLSLRGAWYRFDRLNLEDGVWTKQNTLFRAAGGSRERHAADEIDLTGTWKASRHWKVIAGGAVVLPGPFLKHTDGSARTERWSFIGTTFTF